MKASFQAANSEPFLRISIDAETDDERMLLSLFLRGHDTGMQLAVQGFGKAMGDEGLRYLNIGFERKRDGAR